MAARCLAGRFAARSAASCSAWIAASAVSRSSSANSNCAALSSLCCANDRRGIDHISPAAGQKPHVSRPRPGFPAVRSARPCEDRAHLPQSTSPSARQFLQLNQRYLACSMFPKRCRHCAWKQLPQVVLPQSFHRFRRSRLNGANSAWFSSISPSFTAGHVNLCSCSRLEVLQCPAAACRQALRGASPVPSQESSFRRSVFLARNTKTVPISVTAMHSPAGNE